MVGLPNMCRKILVSLPAFSRPANVAIVGPAQCGQNRTLVNALVGAARWTIVTAKPQKPNAPIASWGVVNPA